MCGQQAIRRPRRLPVPTAPRNERRQSQPDARERRYATWRRYRRRHATRRRPRLSSPAQSTACPPAPRPSRPHPRRRPRRRRGSRPCLRRRARTRRPARPPRAIGRARIESPGRTTATTSGNADKRCRQDATPIAVPAPTPWDVAGSGVSSLAPPKRAPRPAASRIPTKGMLEPRAVASSFLKQPELAVLHDDQHACAVVHAIVIGRPTC